MRWQYPVGRRLSTAILAALSLFTQIGCHWQTIWQLRTSWPWWSPALEARSEGGWRLAAARRGGGATPTPAAYLLDTPASTVVWRTGRMRNMHFVNRLALSRAPRAPAKVVAQSFPQRQQRRRNLPSHLHIWRHSPALAHTRRKFSACPRRQGGGFRWRGLRLSSDWSFRFSASEWLLSRGKPRRFQPARL